MEILNTIQTIAILIFLLLIIWWIYTKRSKKSMPISGKALLITLGISLLVSMASGVAYNSLSHSSTNAKNDIASTDKTTTSSSTESSSSSAPSSSAKSEETTENDVLQSLTTKELKKYNSGLIDSLSEDQDFSENGNTKYDWATYVDTIVYGDRGLIVKVASDFTSLTDKNKSIVAQNSQGLANTQVILLGKDVRADSAPYTSIYMGEKRIGHSHSWNASKFKWDKDA